MIATEDPLLNTQARLRGPRIGAPRGGDVRGQERPTWGEAKGQPLRYRLESVGAEAVSFSERPRPYLPTPLGHSQVEGVPTAYLERGGATSHGPAPSVLLTPGEPQ